MLKPVTGCVYQHKSKGLKRAKIWHRRADRSDLISGVTILTVRLRHSLSRDKQEPLRGLQKTSWENMISQSQRCTCVCNDEHMLFDQMKPRATKENWIFLFLNLCLLIKKLANTIMVCVSARELRGLSYCYAVGKLFRVIISVLLFGWQRKSV